MVEEAYIDKNSHNNDASSTMSCVERYNECISYCIAFTMMHPKTALIITADHECGGIESNGNNFIYTSGNHTNVNVPLFALGGGTREFAQSAYTLENIDVAKFIASIFGQATFGQTGF
jgi:alkaline phosphatase